METATPTNGGVERARGAQFYSIQITDVMFIVAGFTRGLAAQTEGREHRDASKLVCSAITLHSKSGSPARWSLMGNTWAPQSLPLTFYLEHNSIQEARNHMKPNEKTFLPGTESRCSPIHSHLRVN
jgi:hypothetical protein